MDGLGDLKPVQAVLHAGRVWGQVVLPHDELLEITLHLHWAAISSTEDESLHVTGQGDMLADQ